MCSNSMASAHVIFEVNETKIKGGCQPGRKVVPHDSKRDLPQVKTTFLKYSTSRCVVEVGTIIQHVAEQISPRSTI